MGFFWGPPDKQEFCISLSNFEKDLSKIKSKSVVDIIRNTIEIFYLKKYGTEILKENGIINIITNYIYSDHKIYGKRYINTYQNDIGYEIEKLY